MTFDLVNEYITKFHWNMEVINLTDRGLEITIIVRPPDNEDIRVEVHGTTFLQALNNLNQKLILRNSYYQDFNNWIAAQD